MKLLEEMIVSKGKILPGDVLKVGSFLNHQIDTSLLNKMADEVAEKFSDSEITKIITIEASGIAFATAIALKLNVPMVYAKKTAQNVSGDLYQANVFSYTHKTNNCVVVPKDYISKKDKFLIVDDFLAQGNAIEGLISIIEQAGAELVGCAIEIEKAHQKGGDNLRKRGIKVLSLAIIDKMEDGVITFRN